MLHLYFRGRMGRSFFVVACVILLLCSIFEQQVSGFKTTVYPRKTFSMSEILLPNSSIEFFFKMDPGQVIDATVVDSKKKVLKKWVGAGQGIVTLRSANISEHFTVVFDNRDSFFSPKNVNFIIHDLPKPKLELFKLDPIESEIELFYITVEEMFKYQLMLKQMKREHYATVKKTNDTLLLWSILQIVIMLIMSLSQIYFLKRFLERKSFF